MAESGCSLQRESSGRTLHSGPGLKRRDTAETEGYAETEGKRIFAGGSEGDRGVVGSCGLSGGGYGYGIIMIGVS